MKKELKIGEEFEGGIYVGTLYNHAIIMAPKEIIKKLNWYDSIEYCNNLEMNGFSDWYLPNKEELNLIYKSNLIIKGWFWSSMERSRAYSWYQDLNNGYQNQSNKDNSYYCAAVRKVSLNVPDKEIQEIQEIISYRYNNQIFINKNEAELVKRIHSLVKEHGYDNVNLSLDLVKEWL